MNGTTDTCEHCQAALPADARFCRSCGTPVVAPPIAAVCPHCRHANPGDSRFCRACGTWLIVDDGQQMQGYVESKWDSPGSPNDLVKVDMSPASGLPPAQAAAQVHADLLREQGYNEVTFGPGSLTQHAPSVEWIFTLPGSERVDWFFSQCDHDFAVLGSTAPGSFSQLLSSFTSFAESVQATCGQ